MRVCLISANETRLDLTTDSPFTNSSVKAPAEQNTQLNVYISGVFKAIAGFQKS